MLAANTVLQNRYLILRQLGQGGMGAVYQARDERLGSTVILKKTLFSHAHFLKAFQGEARLLANLRHARLPLVMDYFTEGDGHFLVMQFIPGKDLEELLQDRQKQGLGPFTSKQVLKWADQLLDALEYLHRHEPPIVHRDIKPQNLKRTPEDDVVLLDFGLAKGAAAGMTQANQSLHGYTRAYAPLEQIEGTGTEPRSDLYSLAATLYHLMTGERPPDAVTRASALVNAQPDPLRPANELNSQVSYAVATVLHSALANNLNQRPASAAVMRQALRNALEQTLPDSSLVSTIIDAPLNDEPIVTAQSPSSLPTESLVADASPLPPTILDADTKHLSRDETALPTPPRSRKALTISLVLAAVMITGALIAYRAWNQRQVASGSHAISASNAPAPTSSEAAATSPGLAVMHYYLELESKDRKISRALGNEPLPSDGVFKFHFIPHEQGYLYLISPKKNIPTTFLTTQPHPMWQVKNNFAPANKDFEFPGGDATLRISGETPFTVIFSPEPLTNWAFLTGQANHELTPSEQQELKLLRQQFGVSAVNTDMSHNQVIVTVPAARGFKEPLVFDIVLKSQ